MSHRHRVHRAILGVGVAVAAQLFAAVSAAAQVAPAASPRDSSAPTTRMVDMGGYRLRIRTAGTAVTGRPTVIFESGLGTRLENWTGVQRDIAGVTATFTYDRAGIGASDPGRIAPTISHIVDELHALLAKSGTRPPYLLVGHSLGGAAIRLFAARYPETVAGMVYVDPSDFMQSAADQDSLFREIGVPDGRAAFNRGMLEWYRRPGVPAGVRAEAEAFGPEFQAGFPTFRALPPAPEVPTVAVLGGRYDAPSDGLSPVPGGPEKDAAFFTAAARQRMAHLTSLLRVGEPDADGTIVMSPASGHYVQVDEPDLVAWAVRRALFPDPGQRLARAAARGGADSALALYTTLRKTYPTTAFSEGTLNTLGYTLMRRDRLRDALAVFQRNVAEYPAASNPHDSLGEAYMALGDRVKAIEHYERSLALDPANTNAVERLKTLRAR